MSKTDELKEERQETLRRFKAGEIKSREAREALDRIDREPLRARRGRK